MNPVKGEAATGCAPELITSRLFVFDQSSSIPLLTYFHCAGALQHQGGAPKKHLQLKDPKDELDELLIDAFNKL